MAVRSCCGLENLISKLLLRNKLPLNTEAENNFYCIFWVRSRGRAGPWMAVVWRVCDGFTQLGGFLGLASWRGQLGVGPWQVPVPLDEAQGLSMWLLCWCSGLLRTPGDQSRSF